MDTVTSERVINGVDVRTLKETIAAVTEQPSLGRFEFRASNAWLDGGHNRSTIKSFYGAGQEHRSGVEQFVVDNAEPPVLLGQDQAPNPVEYILHALAGCLMTSLIYHAAARHIEIRGVSLRLEGDLDLQGFLGIRDDVWRGYEQVRVVFDIDADQPREVLEELVDIAQRQSPVFDTVTRPVDVAVRLG